jgi:hypothetical protein
MNGQSRTHHEFRVVIDGIDLKPETVDEVNRAVQKIVLQQLANMDTHGDLMVRLPMATEGNGGGGTSGVEIRLVSHEQ